MARMKDLLIDIYTRYKNGESVSDIAERYSLTEGIVLRLIKYQDALEGTC